MRRELTAAKKDWHSMRNDLFEKGDILVMKERIVHPSGRVLCEVGDCLEVMGADCIGCFVMNKSRPELNFSAPKGTNKETAWVYEWWHLFEVPATLVRGEKA